MWLQPMQCDQDRPTHEVAPRLRAPGIGRAAGLRAYKDGRSPRGRTSGAHTAAGLKPGRPGDRCSWLRQKRGLVGCELFLGDGTRVPKHGEFWRSRLPWTAVPSLMRDREHGGQRSPLRQRPGAARTRAAAFLAKRTEFSSLAASLRLPTNLDRCSFPPGSSELDEASNTVACRFEKMYYPTSGCHFCSRCNNAADFASCSTTMATFTWSTNGHPYRMAQPR